MNNFYTNAYQRRPRIGCPSWWAALKFRVYRMTHRDVYAPYERDYMW